MTKVKLSYFNFSGGRGEDCRLAPRSHHLRPLAPRRYHLVNASLHSRFCLPAVSSYYAINLEWW